jgi:hypothetical protein
MNSSPGPTAGAFFFAHHRHAGLVPGIHVFTYCRKNKTWMAGTSPAMTKES